MCQPVSMMQPFHEHERHQRQLAGAGEAPAEESLLKTL
jgi:hypothetical protein